MKEGPVDDPHIELSAQHDCRRFTILDGMILTVSIACYFALLRQCPIFIAPMIGRVSWQSVLDSSETRRLCAVIVIWFLFPAIAVLTPTYLFIRLRRPRPPRRAIVREPGMLSILIGFGLMALIIPVSSVLGLQMLRPYGFFIISIVVGLVWLVASRQDNAIRERGWIRSVGRAIAFGWVLLGLCYAYFSMGQ